MATLLQELGHHNEESRPVKPLGKEASAAAIGLTVGALVMALICMAMKTA
ncbi:MAG: hypothetical protein QNJ91_09885 [Gammaproteobacteria bacterium]|nr:hypothetical protein [Gammaproteobacteria bacterium]